MVKTASWPIKKCPTAVQTVTVDIINGHDIVVAISFETAVNPVHISCHILYVFLLCITHNSRWNSTVAIEQKVDSKAFAIPYSDASAL